MYHVYMVNFDLFKGTFETLEEAKVRAKDLGFDCAIFKGDLDKVVEVVASVRPY